MARQQIRDLMMQLQTLTIITLVINNKFLNKTLDKINTEEELANYIDLHLDADFNRGIIL